MEEKLEILKKYCERYNEFNIFKVLKMQSGSENRHSNFIAWLLDEKGTHGLEKKFFNAFISSVGITDLDNNKYYKIEREESCEVGRPDILIKNGENVVCVIEVKFGAEETTNQLKDYYEEYSKQNCKNFVLLDLDSTNYDKACKKYEKDEKFKFEIYKLATFKDNILKILNDEFFTNQIENKNIKTIIEQYKILLEEEYQLYNGKSIFNTVLKLQKDEKENEINEIFQKYNYEKTLDRDYLSNRRYKIMVLLYKVVKSIENTKMKRPYKNSLTVSFEYNGKDIQLSNSKTKKNSEIVILINGKKPDNPLLFNEDEYNDTLFYVYEENAEETIKTNLKNAIDKKLISVL